MTGRPRVWLLIGRRRGDNNQVLALGEALGVPFETRTIFDKATAPLRRQLFPESVGHVTRASRRWLEPPWPDLVVGIGRRTVPVARWIRKQSGGRTRLVRLGNPCADPKLFDVVITTRQYPVQPAPNVVTLPLAMSRFRAPQPTYDEQAWLDAMPRPHLLLSLGGNAPSLRLSLSVLRESASRLAARAATAGGSLIVIGSPRTSRRAYRAVGEALAGRANCAILSDPAVRYSVLLNDADEHFVTADSVSMLSEAVQTGKPVGIIPVEPDPLGRIMFLADPSRSRFRDPRRVWSDLEEHGLVGTVDAPVNGQVENAVDLAVRAVQPLLRG